MNWSHLHTIVWLRWRLTRNQWSRGGPLNAIVTLIIMSAALVVGVAGGGIGILMGVMAFNKLAPLALLGLFDAMALIFLFFWMIGLMSELQRSESVDISRMRHLPVKLKDIFLINYVASHLCVSIILFAPFMLGLALGLARSRGLVMLWQVPLILAFFFMITAWTYCLRGWLAALMHNQRRRRAVIAGITMTFILVTQLPNLVMNVLPDKKRQAPEKSELRQQDEQATPTPEENKSKSKAKAMPKALVLAHHYVPFLWVGNGVKSLATGHVWPALLGTFGGFALGGWGLSRAYRSTYRFYQGQIGTGRTKQKKKGKKEKTRVSSATVLQTNVMDKTLPGLSDDTAVLTQAFFRSIVRAPEIKTMLATNFIMVIVMAIAFTVRRNASPPETIKPFMATGLIAFSFFGLSRLMFNLFGWDRAGFRTLVLSPVQRRRILFSKNLALLPLALLISGLLQLILRFTLSLPWIVFVCAFLQIPIAFLTVSLLGNLASMLAPYRVGPGTLKATKVPGQTKFMMLIFHLCFPIFISPIFLAPTMGLLFEKLGWLHSSPTNLLFSATLLALVALLYRCCLPSLGRLLQQREKEIMLIVTQEVE
jgi:ABC-2 type transport system permease protein